MNVFSTTFALVMLPLLVVVYFTFLAFIKEVMKLPTIKVNAWFAPNIIWFMHNTSLVSNKKTFFDDFIL